MSLLSDDDVAWIANSPRYDRDVRALAQELRERRANDLKPDQLDGLRFAAGLIERVGSYGSAGWSSATKPELESAAAAIDAVLRAYGEKP